MESPTIEQRVRNLEKASIENQNKLMAKLNELMDIFTGVATSDKPGILERIRILEKAKQKNDTKKDRSSLLVWGNILIPIFTSIATLYIAKQLFGG